MLKLRLASSSFEDFQGTFQRLIPDTSVIPASVDKIIFCTGQVYYDLLTKRDELQAKNVAIERIEQIAPFPYDLVMKSLEKFGAVKSVIWCQEEPMNSGCWTFVQPWFLSIFGKMNMQHSLKYVGPKILSAPSTGDMAQHERIYKEFLSAAF